MVSASNNSNVQHQASEGSSEQTPLTTENLAAHNSDVDGAHGSRSSNDHKSQTQADPNLGYIGSQFNNTTTITEGNVDHDDTPMKRWQRSGDDRPPCWSADEKKEENEQGAKTE